MAEYEPIIFIDQDDPLAGDPEAPRLDAANLATMQSQYAEVLDDVENGTGPIGTALHAAFADKNIIADVTNSWWAWPDAVIDPGTKRVFVSGGSFGGTVKTIWFDLLSGTTGEHVVSDKAVPADDHYTRALLVQSGKPALSVGSYHDQDNRFRVSRTKTPGEFTIMDEEVSLDVSGDGLTGVSYGTIVQRSGYPEQLLFAFRSGGGTTGNTYISRSLDGGETLAAPMRLASRPYFMYRRGAAGGEGHFLSVHHPAAGTLRLSYWRMPLSTGLPVNASGADVRHDSHASSSAWNFAGDPSTPFVDLAKTDVVYERTSGDETIRLLDMFGSGRRIGICRYEDRNDMSGGGDYEVWVRQGSDQVNSWSMETVCPSGASFYEPSGYVGGMCFASDGSVLLCREDTGVWTLERWTRTGTTWAPGTWSLQAVLYTAPAGHVLARPRAIVDCNDWSVTPGMVTVGEYPVHDVNDFGKTYGNQRIISY